MNDYDRQYPQYLFQKHKGYATREHLDALAKHGPSPIHRASFFPIRARRDEDELEFV
jgi:ribonuclease HII